REDAKEYHQVSAFGVDATYDSFLSVFADRDDFGAIRLPFDWRKPLTFTASTLRDKILETYESNGRKPVHLMAHSMGGLLVRAALMKYGNDLWPKVGRIVFLGTPHYGSPAIAGYLKNHLWGFELMSLLGLYFNRATFRSLWGVLSMLPAPIGVYPGTRAQVDARTTIEHPCANFEMYDARAWELNLHANDETRLQKVLDAAAKFHLSMFDAHKELSQEQRGRMAVIAGVGYSTLFRLEFDSRFWGIWEYTNKVTKRIPGQPNREGDGRVPLASATLESIGALRYVHAKHGDLPGIVQVYEDAFRWLKSEPMRLPDTVPGALSQHLAGPLKRTGPNFQETNAAPASADDPGYWDVSTPDPVRLGELRQQLEAGQLPEFQFLHLL
ncbi:MAG TPA: hypothetical protein VEX13_02850, partial [Chloroflexia bacterium]|nr:hypothetical protein [Chloroflexia bacterium]